jgi:hypothetical protein
MTTASMTRILVSIGFTAFGGAALLAACSESTPTTVAVPPKDTAQTPSIAKKPVGDPIADPIESETVIEEMLCGEIQVGWRLTWAGHEPFRRYRKADTKFRLTRTSSSYSFVAPVGTILGLTPVNTNEYRGEEWERLKEERRVTLNATQYAVHCLPERIPPSIVGGSAPE